MASLLMVSERGYQPAGWMLLPEEKRKKKKTFTPAGPSLHGSFACLCDIVKELRFGTSPLAVLGEGNNPRTSKRERSLNHEFENGNTSLPIRLEAAPLARSPSTLCKSSTPLLMRQVREAGELNRAMERWA